MENQTSFDLNAGIQRWRSELAGSSSLRADDIDELESHIRDSVTSLQTRGLTVEEAYLIAVRRTGSHKALDREFALVNGSAVWQDRLLWMIAGWILMSAFSSVTTKLVMGMADAWFHSVVLSLALILGLGPALLRKPLGPALRLGLGFSLIIVFVIMLKTSPGRSLTSFSYVLYNINVFAQCLATAGLIAVVTLKRRKGNLV
jgi:hypothetical protein